MGKLSQKTAPFIWGFRNSFIPCLKWQMVIYQSALVGN